MLEIAIKFITSYNETEGPCYNADHHYFFAAGISI
jgi:hypothetical protein